MKKGDKDSARKLDKDIYPRAECFECTNQWKPRKIREGEVKICSNCYSGQTKVWNKDKKLVCEPRPKKGVGKDGIKEIVPVGEQPLDERQKEIAKDTHIRLAGVQTIPTLEMESQILLFAESVKMGMNENLKDFILYIINWMEIFREVKMRTGIVLNPTDFSSQFISLLSQASKVDGLTKEIRNLKVKINEIEKFRKTFEELSLNDTTVNDVIPPIGVESQNSDMEFEGFKFEGGNS